MRKYLNYIPLVLRYFYLYNLKFIVVSAEVRNAGEDGNEQKCDSTWVLSISMFSSSQIEVKFAVFLSKDRNGDAVLFLKNIGDGSISVHLNIATDWPEFIFLYEPIEL